MKTLLKIVVGLVLLLGLAAGALVFFFDADRFRPRLEQALTDALLDFSGPADLEAWLKQHGG